MTMKIKPCHLMQRKDQTRERFVIILLEEIKSFKGEQAPKETTHPLNASHATRWDTLQEIFHSNQNNSRRSSMLMQLKKMNQLKKGTMKMKTLLKNMF